MAAERRLNDETIAPTAAEVAGRASVLAAVKAAVVGNQRVLLPQFDPSLVSASPETALHSVGLEPNPFGGTLGEFRYQLEGEEDLLHLIVTRRDGGRLSVEQGQRVAGFLLQGMPSALVWLKPGDFTQHFYLGHDDLIAHLSALGS